MDCSFNNLQKPCTLWAYKVWTRWESWKKGNWTRTRVQEWHKEEATVKELIFTVMRWLDSCPAKRCDPLLRPIVVSPRVNSCQTTTRWRGTVAATSQFPLLLFPYSWASQRWSGQYISNPFSKNPLLIFPGETHTGTVSRHFLILPLVRWLNTHFSGSRTGRYIPYSFNSTWMLKRLGSWSFSCL